MFDAWKSLETGVLIEVPRRELPGFREYNDSAFDDFGRWATTVYSGRGSRHCYEIKFLQAITLQAANCAIQLSLPIIPSVLKSLLLGFLAVILSPHENHVFRPDSGSCGHVCGVEPLYKQRILPYATRLRYCSVTESAFV
jgi:hypothetical protein